MPKQKVNGIEIYYELHGRGDPLVLIMGLRRNIEWWYRQLPALSAQFPVLVFDNRGAGRTDKPAMEYSIRLFADDTAQLMKSLKIESAQILRVSMGGYIAQELAIHYPAMARGLIHSRAAGQNSGIYRNLHALLPARRCLSAAV